MSVKNNKLIIGSRSSKLALTQTEMIKGALSEANPGLDIEVRTIKTTGDKILDVPLSKIGDKGLFTKEIEEALLSGEIDLAVHSMKDLPTEVPEGLRIAAITKREKACDILVSSGKFDIGTLPGGSKIGTSSLRRRAQLLNLRSDLEILELRGNLDTRLRKLEEKSYDAIILAYAGVKRLGVEVGAAIIDCSDILPQAGQGALGIEIRQNDSEVENLVNILDDADSRVCIESERTILGDMGGGCQVPIGVYAVLRDENIVINGGVFSLDGKIAVKDEISGDKKDACVLAGKLAARLLENGGKEILHAIMPVQDDLLKQKNDNDTV